MVFTAVQYGFWTIFSYFTGVVILGRIAYYIINFYARTKFTEKLQKNGRKFFLISSFAWSSVLRIEKKVRKYHHR
jgi:hypothetical protein